ncbi:MAG: class I SAM-dependent methyltransferase [Proteobacteria bacterium]|nr:MAG: class I SAM-dependent methyltransferase [Pseudomonadota bacterium]
MTDPLNLPGTEPLDIGAFRLGERRATLVETIRQLDRLRPKIMVETGCQHTELAYEHGLSTTLFGMLARRYGATLYTVDSDAEHLRRCRKLTLPYANHIEYVHLDSLQVLREFSGVIDFLYLDSLDFKPGAMEQSRIHQLSEIVYAWPRLAERSLVLLDDANVQKWFSQSLGPKDREGKTFYAHRYLRSRGARCLMDIPNYQRLYRLDRSSSGAPSC